jgi:hypothetical protein
MPDFWQAQFENHELDLEALAARLAVDIQLRRSSRKRGTHLSIGRPNSATQLSLAFPSSVAAGTRASTRGRNASRKWALYAGKSAEWSRATAGRASSHSLGATTGRDVVFHETMARENLNNLTMIF